MALSQSSVLRLYINVIEETIASSRDAFIDEGVDEQVLMELKQLWENKITSSKAVQAEPALDQTEPSTSTAPKRANKRNAEPTSSKPIQPLITNGNHVPPPVPTSSQTVLQPSHPPPPPIYSNMLDPTKIVPIQITLPPQAGTQESRVLTIQVPATALIGNQLQQVLTGPVISATMGLPQPQASNLLQQHVNAALQGQNSPLMAKSIPQVDGSSNDTYCNVHLDENDSSEDGEDVSDEPSEDDEIDALEDLEDPDINQVRTEEEPLNSEDDVSEEDPGDLFDTENVVVCQYDKINRSRNRWKFYLKDGIMNLNGKDYVFQKVTGDAEW